MQGLLAHPNYVHSAVQHIPPFATCLQLREKEDGRTYWRE